jgi:predicted peptidase
MFSLGIVSLLILATMPQFPTFGARQETGFLNRTITIEKKVFKYQVYVPSNWNKRQRWPVILFLHAAGERGDDGIIQTEVGIGTAVRRYTGRFPCVVVFPQCRTGLWWTDPQMEAMALKALAQAIKEFKGDPQRTYLTGISMGGYGTWGIAADYPGRFAALAPVCGGVRLPSTLTTLKLNRESVRLSEAPNPYKLVAQKVGKTPVWIFHGGADNTVPVSESRRMAQALKDAGGEVTYTEYEGVGHNSWDRAYAESRLIPWILSKRLGK